MSARSAFDLTKANSSPTKSSATSARAKNPSSGGTSVKHSSSRGVEHPIAEDMALIGDTRHELHSKSLSRRTGPNYGADTTKAPGPDHLRVDCGDGMDGEV